MVTWQELARLPEDGLGRIDIAVVNLACAADLPDARNYDFNLCLRSLDLWAMFVREYTNRMMPQFYRRPHEYKNSANYFRVLCMVTLLQRDLGLRYNPAKIPSDVPLGPADTFIYGAILGAGGTCASIPVVLAAVGRRLGYPIKLVSARAKQTIGHLFARWDDSAGERFNIEATNTGLVSKTDEYYRTGIYEISPALEQAAGYLRSLTPQHELAFFLIGRAYCWIDLCNYRRAVEALAWAAALVPDNRSFLATLKMTLNEWTGELERMKPSGFPPLSIIQPARRFPLELPLEMERYILGLEVMENVLKDPEHDYRWWQPMRHGLRPRPQPVQVVAKFARDGCTVFLDLAY